MCFEEIVIAPYMVETQFIWQFLSEKFLNHVILVMWLGILL